LPSASARDDTNAEILKQALRQVGAIVAIDSTYGTRTGLEKFPAPSFNSSTWFWTID
jgi:hypothetical protein